MKGENRTDFCPNKILNANPCEPQSQKFSKFNRDKTSVFSESVVKRSENKEQDALPCVRALVQVLVAMQGRSQRRRRETRRSRAVRIRTPASMVRSPPCSIPPTKRSCDSIWKTNLPHPFQSHFNGNMQILLFSAIALAFYFQMNESFN